LQRRPDSPGTAGALSLTNVEKTREFIEAYNRRDFETAIRWFDPQVQWVLPEQQGFDSCVGPDQIILWWEELDDIYDELRLDPQEYVDAGDQVAVRLRHFAKGKGSGIALDNELYHQVTTFRAGKMIRIEYLASWPAALRAAGVDAEHPPLQ
jgi:ketosteroid isomerase-like protein